MHLSGNDLNIYFPAYLTDKAKGKMSKLVRDFAARRSELPYFQDINTDLLLQGDCLEGVPLYNHLSSKLSERKVMVISNTCDIAPENKRNEAIQVTVAPILKFRGLKDVWRKEGASDERITAALDAIENQENTQYFYLPPSPLIDQKCAVSFARAQSMPIKLINELKDPLAKLSLSQAGFWLLTLKLSMHFCRLHEGVKRGI